MEQRKGVEIKMISTIRLLCESIARCSKILTQVGNSAGSIIEDRRNSKRSNQWDIHSSTHGIEEIDSAKRALLAS